ncbi:hypothetical protein [Streptomyces nanshensis]|uniref:HPr kinase n=1 Tax=Streptomyces nanshensis TaxID=518642 RepID=A0A1E7KCV2_9ACTN|nr:hypothetical protein [Streptomyces nanshensis]OEV01758.1 hypothetical protein AN218_33450 [Streptomyces nanshensis]
MTEDVHVIASMDTVAVRLRAPRAVVGELDRLAAPYITTTAAETTHEETYEELPSVLFTSEPPEGDGWERVVNSSEYEPDRVVWADRTRRSVAVVGDPVPTAWQSQQLLRSVRHLLRWQAYARGDLLLHGGLVSAQGAGIVFTGGKRSGKTSSILSSLLHAKADFVSNDDVALTESAGGLVGYGTPRTVNIRTDSLLALAETAPGMKELLRDCAHPTNGYRGRHRTLETLTTDSGTELPGSLWVRCAELARATGCSLSPRGTVDAVVLPKFDGATQEPRIEPLTPEEAGAALQEHIEWQGTKYDPFLAEWFPETDAGRRQRLVERLVAEVPFLALTQNMHGLGAATDLVVAAALGAPARP